MRMISFDKKDEEYLQKEKQRCEKKIVRQITRTQQKLDEKQRELAYANQWADVQHEGLLIQANLFRLQQGMEEISVQDWLQEGKERTLKVNPQNTLQKEAVDRFLRSKKLKRSIKYIQGYLKTLEDRLNQLKTTHNHLIACQSIEELQSLGFTFAKRQSVDTAKKDQKASIKKPYHEFISQRGIFLWVGKNALDNEKMTFSYARGSDWWLHVNNYPGSHVIIKTHKGHEPDSDTLQDAIQLALAYSKAKDRGEAEIILTQCKYVRRLSKATPGKVHLSKHKTLRARFDPQRFHCIRERALSR